MAFDSYPELVKQRLAQGENVMNSNSNDKEKKTVTIIVDGTPHEVEKEKVSYADIVTLAYPDYPQHPEITYSVTYKRGPSANHEGILVPGGTVMVKKDMEFNVSRTGQS